MKLQAVSMDGLFSFGEEIIKRVWPDPEEQKKALIEFDKLRMQGDLAQMKINLQEASHESIFIAGWRPFVGWVCAGAFAYAFVLQPIMIFSATLLGADLSDLPDLDLSAMMPVLMGLLGLGWLRTQEKRQNANRNR